MLPCRETDLETIRQKITGTAGKKSTLQNVIKPDLTRCTGPNAASRNVEAAFKWTVQGEVDHKTRSNRTFWNEWIASEPAVVARVTDVRWTFVKLHIPEHCMWRDHHERNCQDYDQTIQYLRPHDYLRFELSDVILYACVLAISLADFGGLLGIAISPTKDMLAG
jgi:hypothetical protein